MCGRYNLTANSEAIVEHFQLLRCLVPPLTGFK
jgi:putative SOS response-associated peptidase YedK